MNIEITNKKKSTWITYEQVRKIALSYLKEEKGIDIQEEEYDAIQEAIIEAAMAIFEKLLEKRRFDPEKEMVRIELNNVCLNVDFEEDVYEEHLGIMFSNIFSVSSTINEDLKRRFYGKMNSIIVSEDSTAMHIADLIEKNDEKIGYLIFEDPSYNAFRHFKFSSQLALNFPASRIYIERINGLEIDEPIDNVLACVSDKIKGNNHFNHLALLFNVLQKEEYENEHGKLVTKFKLKETAMEEIEECFKILKEQDYYNSENENFSKLDKFIVSREYLNNFFNDSDIEKIQNIFKNNSNRDLIIL